MQLTRWRNWREGWFYYKKAYNRSPSNSIGASKGWSVGIGLLYSIRRHLVHFRRCATLAPIGQYDTIGEERDATAVHGWCILLCTLPLIRGSASCAVPWR